MFDYKKVNTKRINKALLEFNNHCPNINPEEITISVLYWFDGEYQICIEHTDTLSFSKVRLTEKEGNYFFQYIKRS